MDIMTGLFIYLRGAKAPKGVIYGRYQHCVVAVSGAYSHSAGTDHKRGVFLAVYRHPGGRRAVCGLLAFRGAQPCIRGRHGLPAVRRLERRHTGVPGSIGRYGHADEPRRRLGGLRTLVRGARQDQGRRADRHHDPGRAHLHRRLFQLPHRGLRNEASYRQARHIKAEAGLSHRRHCGSGMHHSPDLQLGGCGHRLC